MARRRLCSVLAGAWCALAQNIAWTGSADSLSSVGIYGDVWVRQTQPATLGYHGTLMVVLCSGVDTWCALAHNIAWTGLVGVSGRRQRAH